MPVAQARHPGAVAARRVRCRDVPRRRRARARGRAARPRRVRAAACIFGVRGAPVRAATPARACCSGGALPHPHFARTHTRSHWCCCGACRPPCRCRYAGYGCADVRHLGHSVQCLPYFNAGVVFARPSRAVLRVVAQVAEDPGVPCLLGVQVRTCAGVCTCGVRVAFVRFLPTKGEYKIYM